MTTLQPRLRFESSYRALAHLALRETSALGWALFHKAPDAPAPRSLRSIGREIPVEALAEPAPDEVLIFPLSPAVPGTAADAWIAFLFADRNTAAAAIEPLARIAESFSELWATRGRDVFSLALLRRITAIEADLMDSRIADRVNGLLATPAKPDLLETVVSHVTAVTRPEGTAEVLRSSLRELEEELAERRVTGQAKAVLQATQSLTEEEAHLHLRILSRRSRRRIKDIALEIVRQSRLEVRTA